MLGSQLAAGGIGSSATAISVAMSLSRLNSRCQVSSSHSTMPTREHVGARVERLAARLLGRHVRELALEQPGLRLLRDLRRVALAMPKSTSFTLALVGRRARSAARRRGAPGPAACRRASGARVRVVEARAACRR